MRYDRRRFAKLLAGTALAGLVRPDSLLGAAPTNGLASATRGRGARRAFFEWRPIGTRIHAAIGQGGNVMLLRDGGQALISDSKNLGYGYTLRREAEAFGTPLTYAINTHHHGDHIGGNAAFTTDIPLISHTNAQTRIRTWAQGTVGQANERLARAATEIREQGGDAAAAAEIERLGRELESMSADRFVPTQVLTAENEIRVGGRTVQLRWVDRGHTDNDVFLFVPDENVMHTGDLLFVGRHPFIDTSSGATTVGWQRILRAMIDTVNAETTVIPGHGDITNRAGLQRQWDYFEQTRDAVTAAVREGRTREQVLALTPAAIADVPGSPQRTLGVIYDEVTGG